MPTTKLLLIEDDEETVEAITGYFTSRGYEVAQAATGPDGLARASAGGIDALIVDRLLPGLDGLVILTTLRQNGIRTPAIMRSTGVLAWRNRRASLPTNRHAPPL